MRWVPMARVILEATGLEARGLNTLGLDRSFETGNPGDDGWPLWGGGSGHNGS
jgi:hypothetical protein